MKLFLYFVIYVYQIIVKPMKNIRIEPTFTVAKHHKHILLSYLRVYLVTFPSPESIYSRQRNS